ncbi:hypothetical protein IZY60_12500 [Lutibacter sp. B2]|nr:hypothetical protein [Lutibacter sp. B2]
MIFPDYEKTGVVYHVIHITDLKKTLQNGIKYDDKFTYKANYDGFHELIDKYRPLEIPNFVIRNKSIFASMNFPKKHAFHSHSAILAIKISNDQCWIANENYANQIYEPFELQNIEEFSKCKKYLDTKGIELLEKYWHTSLSFNENLKKRKDQEKGYDAEILITHTIPPEDIEVLFIISDHRMLSVKEWKKTFLVK